MSYLQPVIVQHSSSLSSLAHASALLDISVQALEDSQQEELQPTDMVSLIQLLSMAADVPTGQHHSVDATNQSREGLHEMSKDYIKVADSIISQDSVVKWQAIREVRAVQNAEGLFLSVPVSYLPKKCLDITTLLHVLIVSLSTDCQPSVIK